MLTAVTNQLLAWRRVVPFRVHGQVDTRFCAYSVAFNLGYQRAQATERAPLFYVFTVVALTNYLLIDYDAPE